MIQDKSLCENSMAEACKSIQESFGVIFQLVKTSQATGRMGKVPTLIILPMGFSLSPKEFSMAKDGDFWHNIQHSCRVNLGAEKKS